MMIDKTSEFILGDYGVQADFLKLCYQSMLWGLEMTSVGVQEAGVVGIEHACSKVLVDIAKEVATSV